MEVVKFVSFTKTPGMQVVKFASFAKAPEMLVVNFASLNQAWAAGCKVVLLKKGLGRRLQSFFLRQQAWDAGCDVFPSENVWDAGREVFCLEESLQMQVMKFASLRKGLVCRS